MRAFLQFELPDDDGEHKLALNGGKYFAAMWDFKESLRMLFKHGEPTPEQIRQTWETATEDIDWTEIP